MRRTMGRIRLFSSSLLAIWAFFSFGNVFAAGPTASPIPSPLPPPAVPISTPSVSRGHGDIDFDRIEDTRIYFKTADGSTAPKSVKTDLYDLKYLGAIKPNGDIPGALPYFLLSGRPCQDCLQDIGIYALRPSGGRPEAYVYPGKILEHKTRAVVLESRSFFGHCLPRQSGSVYVVFQKERIDRHGMLPSVLIAEPGTDHMDERLMERHLPKLQDTLRLVKNKVCHEIDGRNRIMLSKPLDIRARHVVDQNQEGDDDDADGNVENSADDDTSTP